MTTNEAVLEKDLKKNEAVFTKDLKNKTLFIRRVFDAPLEMVWRAWTESELLNQWWAPKPYRCDTGSMEFRPGGQWLYSMVGPEGTKTWCKEVFEKIDLRKKIISTAYFCDDKGNLTPGFPAMHWKKEFSPSGGQTLVRIELGFDREADLEQIVAMGFQEGFTMGMNNLDQYLNTQFRLRKELNTERKARVTTFLNFPGKTEEAFLFYKKVFGGEFTGTGLQRFGDIELPAGGPPLSEADKKLIIHAELTIFSGHVLMATDAPESMGFKIQPGNNMHITWNPDRREETERLFVALSEGGVVTMPLQDIFWGAYFASFTDKYGVNWMLNYQS